MKGSKNSGRYGMVWACARPLAAGLTAGFALTLLIIAACSLFFTIVRSIADSAILPLALIAAGIGAFLGGYICAAVNGRYGLLMGALVGTLMFAVIWIIGILGAGCAFGTENIIKVFILVGGGCVGGCLGRRHGQRRR